MKPLKPKKPRSAKHNIRGIIIESPVSKIIASYQKLKPGFQIYGKTYIKGKGYRITSKDIGLRPGGEPVRTISRKRIVKGYKAVPVSIYDIDPGTVITFSYRGFFAHDPQPIIISLSGPPFMGKVHGINLKYLTDSQIRDLYRFVLENFKEAQNPKYFYDNYVKGYLKQLKAENVAPYRTYIIYNMRNVRMYKTLLDLV